MPPRALRIAVLTAVTPLALLALAACGGGGGAKATPTSPAVEATPTIAVETGEDPVFYRTEDDFASLTAGTAYKVVFRVTNGYAGETLTVVANREAGGQPVTFTGNLVMPQGGDAPGSFYTMNILLPQPGAWNLVVQAGADQVTVPVTAGEPGPASAG